LVTCAVSCANLAALEVARELDAKVEFLLKADAG
jgi:hypothetical protein